MRIPWIKFRVGDWREGTDELSLVEYGVYHKICARIWEEGKAVHRSSVPNLFSGVSYGDVEQALERLVLIGKVWIDEEGRCWNQQAADTHNQAEQRIKQTREAGQESGRRRQIRKLVAQPGKAVVPQELPLDDPPPLVPDRTKHPIIETDRLKMIYPKNDRGFGSQRWMSVQRELMDRISEDGDTFEVILEGTKRYAGYAEAAGLIGTQNIYSVMTFYGKDRLYLAEWAPPQRKKTKAQLTEEENKKLLDEQLAAIEKERESNGTE